MVAEAVAAAGAADGGWWGLVCELVKVGVRRVEWKLFAMTWRLLVRCCEL